VAKPKVVLVLIAIGLFAFSAPEPMIARATSADAALLIGAVVDIVTMLRTIHLMTIVAKAPVQLHQTIKADLIASMVALGTGAQILRVERHSEALIAGSNMAMLLIECKLGHL
jgi:hypothetical protein